MSTGEISLVKYSSQGIVTTSLPIDDELEFVCTCVCGLPLHYTVSLGRLWPSIARPQDANDVQLW